MHIDKKYLHLPVRTGAQKVVIGLTVGGEQVREFDAELDSENPDFTAAADVGAFVGQTVTVTAKPLPPKSAQLEAAKTTDFPVLLPKSLTQGDELTDNGPLYGEKLRPQFHFSSKIGWINDPNGLMYYDGEYHLFYQHNPFGWSHGNMHWGHAVSRDLIHWVELDEALFPDESGTMFSGSGVVDHNNSLGLQRGSEKTLVCIYTAAGGSSPWSASHPFTQCIAYSNDRGRTWQKHACNPVLNHIVAENRDPKVIWHEATSRWIMALYLDKYEYALFCSPNLLKWERTCDLTIAEGRECPDFFGLPVDGDSANTWWVFWTAGGPYLLGRFDGKKFTAEGEPLRFQFGRSYAAQTWSDIPASDSRRMQIAWLQGDKPGMPFNQQMSFPCELSLRSTPKGVRMFAEPVRELERLRLRRVVLDPSLPMPDDLGELLELRLTVDLPTHAAAGRAVLSIRGIEVVYDRGNGTLTLGDQVAPLHLVGESLALQILVDRSSIEVFAQHGVVTLSVGFIPTGKRDDPLLRVEGGNTGVCQCVAFELKSIWPKSRSNANP